MQLIRCTTAFVAVAMLPAAVAQPDLAPLPPVSVSGTGSVADRNLVPNTTESITADQIAEKINVINVEDALKYLPSLIVRKRNFGDQQAPLATRTSGLGQSARSLIYADGLLLSALIGNNNTFAAPRGAWSRRRRSSASTSCTGRSRPMYPGNSMGAVVEMTTRMPREFEAGVKVAGASQSLRAVRDQRRYRNVAGERVSGWQDERSCPGGSAATISTATRSPWASRPLLRPATPSAAGTPVDRRLRRPEPHRRADPGAGRHGLRAQRAGQREGEARLRFHARVARHLHRRLLRSRQPGRRETYLRNAAGKPVYSAA